MSYFSDLRSNLKAGKIDSFNMHYAKTNFSKLVNCKKPIIIATRGKPMAVMIPINDIIK